MNIEKGLYKHYKGDYYIVLGTAKSGEDGSTMVEYMKIKTGEIFIRFLSIFTENVQAINDPEVTLPRYQRITDLENSMHELTEINKFLNKQIEKLKNEVSGLNLTIAEKANNLTLREIILNYKLQKNDEIIVYNENYSETYTVGDYVDGYEYGLGLKDQYNRVIESSLFKLIIPNKFKFKKGVVEVFKYIVEDPAGNIIPTDRYYRSSDDARKMCRLDPKSNLEKLNFTKKTVENDPDKLSFE